MIGKKTAIYQIISIISALTLIFYVFVLTWIDQRASANVWAILVIPFIIYLFLAISGVTITIWQYKQKDQ